MKYRVLSMVLVAGMMLGTAFEATAQYGKVRTKPDASPNAMVEQTIGIDSKISVAYSRPGVKGREIWGTKLAGYDTDKPWRAGADETTAITFSDDVVIGGETVPAGTYGVHIALSKDTWTWVINKDYKTWGSYQYKPENDVVRVDAKPEDAPHQERLRYGFDIVDDDTVHLFMHWEKKKLPLEISLAE